MLLFAYATTSWQASAHASRGRRAVYMCAAPEVTTCRYDHLQFFVDDLQPLAHYKAIEERLNKFAKLVPCLLYTSPSPRDS